MFILNGLGVNIVIYGEVIIPNPSENECRNSIRWRKSSIEKYLL